MTEWLTTGQMIDRLKVGEVAQAYKNNELRFEIKRTSYYYQPFKNITTNDNLILNDDLITNFKWRILPKYVSFEEALKALREGKTIKYNFSKTDDNQNLYVNKNRMKEISSVWILSDLWTIEE